ncbi:hypothetical protein K474DRAFT_1697560 [Panus rudis PR-1116 ss-1]|nr:hypothetical protein K474DRAFT_1697560 [Panus rudis PR-1116 ss-1]
MPSFADLKDRASKVKDASVSKVKDTRDKYSSVSSKKMDWDPNHKRPPPPPPASRSSLSDRSRSSSYAPPPPPVAPGPPPPPAPRAAAPPPIIRRDTRPDQPGTTSNVVRPPSSSSATPDASSRSQIDWANLSGEDKQTLFQWLDEYFATRFNISSLANASHSAPAPVPTHGLRAPLPARTLKSNSPSALDASFTTSYPPACTHGSQAADLAHYFHPSTHWDSAWYTSEPPTPPPYEHHAPPLRQFSWEWYGPSKTVYGAALWEDLSICWYIVKFSTSGNADPNDSRAVQRSARYIPRPAPWDGARLVQAHETYGETIAGFAESYEDTGEYCASGECWDLANEALKYFEQFDYVPKPLPSTSRTHGHLIFEGKAIGPGLPNQIGRWRGGDDRVRRGDIVQWLTARLGMPNGGEATMGNPDHTAVIVKDAVPSTEVSDGAVIKPGALGVLEVVEQGVGSPPKRARYDLNLLKSGELWIYRPVGMESYLGTKFEVKCPSHVNAISI